MAYTRTRTPPPARPADQRMGRFLFRRAEGASRGLAVPRLQQASQFCPARGRRRGFSWGAGSEEFGTQSAPGSLMTGADVAESIAHLLHGACREEARRPVQIGFSGATLAAPVRHSIASSSRRLCTSAKRRAKSLARARDSLADGALAVFARHEDGDFHRLPTDHASGCPRDRRSGCGRLATCDVGRASRPNHHRPRAATAVPGNRGWARLSSVARFVRSFRMNLNRLRNLLGNAADRFSVNALFKSLCEHSANEVFGTFRLLLNLSPAHSRPAPACSLKISASRT
jgi:hypothetical protein